MVIVLNVTKYFIYDNSVRHDSHNAITNVNTHRHNQPLGVGNGCMQNES